MTAIVTLLNTVKGLQQRDSNVRLRAVQSLLRNPVIRDELSTRKVRRQLLAERFNVFSALGLDRRENYHSRFLAYLLDAQSDHDQGSFFIERLLHLFWELEKDKFPKSSVLHDGSSRIVAEQFADDYGRPDLVIYLPNDTVVAIENKIDHVEGERQLPRYRAWLKSLRPADHSGKKRLLVFLTPDRREPASANDRDDPKVDLLLGYGDLVKWLSNCILELPSTATQLTKVLEQYQQLCKTIAGEPDLTKLKNEVLTLIRQPENLEAALEIAEQLDELKIEIRKSFRENVVAELRTLLNNDKNWRASQNEVNSEVGIFYQTHTNGGVMNYHCMAQNVFSNNGGFGWCRPSPVDRNILKKGPPDSKDLAASVSGEMSDQGFRECTDWWVGRKPLDESFKQWNDVAIVKIHKDNEAEHTLAKNLATQIWNCFKDNKDGIEALITKKP